VRSWQKLGVSRIILSRELSLDEVAEIPPGMPDIELEVFVHGALCVAYSGRCLLSVISTTVTRTRARAPTPAAGTTSSKPARKTRAVTCIRAPRSGCSKRKERPGELMPIEEDEHGTYIMNSKDLRAIEHVQRLVESASIR